MARSMKRWHRVLYFVAVPLTVLGGRLFGDAFRLAVVAACVVFLIWLVWKQTKSGASFREAVAEVFPPHDRRMLLGLVSMVALLGLGLMMPAAYYYGVTGFPWHLIASGVVVVACLAFGWRARRSAQVSAGSQRGEPSPSNGEPGIR